MELKKLTLKDGERIMIGADIEVSISVARKGDTLKISGPFNCESKTVILSRNGMEIIN